MTETIALCPESVAGAGNCLPGGIVALDDECDELMETRRGWVSHRAFLVPVTIYGEPDVI